MARIEKLPLFPLGIVLYPGERIPLHIFEPRYKEMIRHCQTTQRPFGIVLFNEGEMASIGCMCRVDRVLKQYEDGRLDLLVLGLERLRIERVYDEFTYMTADVEVLEKGDETIDTDSKERAITQHMRLLELAGRTVRPSLYENVEEVSYVLAHNAGLTLEQKQELLELGTEDERIAQLIRHFETLIPRVEQIEDLRRKVQSNGHFRDFPPEQ